jgi:hypothetical protein
VAIFVFSRPVTQSSERFYSRIAITTLEAGFFLLLFLSVPDDVSACDCGRQVFR